MSPIEQAARAICVIRNENPDDVDVVWGHRWKEYVPEVRAALMAIREPSEGMKEAGSGAFLPDTVDVPEGATYQEAKQEMRDRCLSEAYACWLSMIDAALAEKG